jgi:HAL2 family 3'(2'),5'-bisphosphate nucleotidase
MTQDLDRELQIAVDAVRAASRVCVAVRARLVSEQTLTKKDRSPVTVADFASQAVVCATLADRLAEDPVVAEEDSRELQNAAPALLASVVEHTGIGLGRKANEAQVLSWIDTGGAATEGRRFWTLDPIDGTKGFLRGGQYVVALALIEEAKVVLGVLGCPGRSHAGGTGTLVAAVAGGPTIELPLDGSGLGSAERLRVSDVAAGGAARFCESVESAHSDQSRSVAIAGRLGITADPVRMDSQAKYAAVASGEASIYMRLPTKPDYRECIWDHAAGSIVVEQAGGRVSDIDGAPLDYTHGRRFEANRGVVATNGLLHDAVIDAIAATA